MTIRLPVLVAALVWLFALAPNSGAAEKVEIVVAAGKHDRTNVPVRAVFDTPPGDALFGPGEVEVYVTAVRSGDDLLPAHQSPVALLDAGPADDRRRELTFIIPSLPAGKTATFELELKPQIRSSKAAADEPVTSAYQWAESKSAQTDLVFRSAAGVEPVLRYVHPKLDETDAETRELTYKPFHHVYSPDGKRIVTKGPGGRYTHHRGIYFGFNRVTYGEGRTCDVWHCSKGAHQSHEKVLASENGFVLGRHRVQIGWHGAQGEKFAEEQRELTVYNVAGGQFIEFASLVKTSDGRPIKLDGDPQHAGFHFRADNEVAEKTLKQTYFLRPDGKGAPGETRNWDAKKRDPKAVSEPWKVMSFVLGDTRYSALYLDHPNNPKEARSSERDYGRFGTYFEYEITKDQPLRVNYRLILKEGEFTPEEAARYSADFTDPPKVTVKKL